VKFYFTFSIRNLIEIRLLASDKKYANGLSDMTSRRLYLLWCYRDIIVGNSGVPNPGGGKILRTNPGHPWGPTCLLYNSKLAEEWRWLTIYSWWRSWAWVEINFSLPSVHCWACKGQLYIVYVCLCCAFCAREDFLISVRLVNHLRVWVQVRRYWIVVDTPSWNSATLTLFKSKHTRDLSYCMYSHYFQIVML
jgi:hypothetical protein